jgi:two-component system sensor histidine kinase KdpD
MTLADARPKGKPEDFLELVSRAKRGRLKIYIGSAAGVGKTYRMLEEAMALKKRGVDVVVGFIETHDRAETRAMVGDLEIVPRRQIEYRGVVVEEMDVDAIIARRPEVAIVDELAHSNVPESKNAKRFQDVLAILGEGINVISAFNVQHLESLNDLVRRVTGVTVRETIPDGFLKNADQIIMLDLSIEDLIERLKAGKIYAADKIPWALEHFFTSENLASLRELALREVAERVERTHKLPAVMSAPAPSVSGRIMVCLASYSPRAKLLLYEASKLAGRLNTDWFVVYVETPKEAPHLIDATAQRYLLENLEKARELGAEVVRLREKDSVHALIDFARSHGVRHIIVGRSDKPFWHQLLTRSPTLRLIREAQDFNLHIIALGSSEASAV